MNGTGPTSENTFEAILRRIVKEEIQSLKAELNGHGKHLLTAGELADHLRMPISWVYEQSRLGKIPTHKLGRYIRFDLHEVLASQKKD